jgi:hypothetical protein
MGSPPSLRARRGRVQQIVPSGTLYFAGAIDIEKAKVFSRMNETKKNFLLLLCFLHSLFLFQGA